MVDRLPDNVPDLLKFLDEQYPHRSPSIQDSERAIWMKAGKRQLVDNLLTIYNEEEPFV
jgi:hypothetical protein